MSGVMGQVGACTLPRVLPFGGGARLCRRSAAALTLFPTRGVCRQRAAAGLCHSRAPLTSAAFFSFIGAGQDVPCQVSWIKCQVGEREAILNKQSLIASSDGEFLILLADYCFIKHHRNQMIKDELEIERVRKHDKKKHGDGD